MGWAGKGIGTNSFIYYACGPFFAVVGIDSALSLCFGFQNTIVGSATQVTEPVDNPVSSV